MRFCVPLLDKVITEFGDRFEGAAGIAANLLYLVPSVQGVHKEGLKNSINLYKTNLPNPDLLQTELTLFKSTKSNLKEEKNARLSL